jgi:acyl carrier protein
MAITREQLDEVKRFLVGALEIPDIEPEEIEDDEPLFGDHLGLDSIDALTLVVALKREYGVQVPDAATSRAHFESIRTLAEFLESASGDGPAGST